MPSNAAQPPGDISSTPVSIKNTFPFGETFGSIRPAETTATCCWPASTARSTGSTTLAPSADVTCAKPPSFDASAGVSTLTVACEIALHGFGGPPGKLPPPLP